MKTHFTNCKEGDKVETTNKDGYYIPQLCGYVAKILPEGDAIIKSHEGFHYSSVGLNYKIHQVEIVK